MPIVLKSGSIKLLEPSGCVQACTGIAVPFYVREAVGEKSSVLHDLELSEVCPRNTRSLETTRAFPNKANQHTLLTATAIQLHCLGYKRNAGVHFKGHCTGVLISP